MSCNIPLAMISCIAWFWCSEVAPFELVNTYGTGTVVQELIVDVTDEEFKFAYFGRPSDAFEGVFMSAEV